MKLRIIVSLLLAVGAIGIIKAIAVTATNNGKDSRVSQAPSSTAQQATPSTTDEPDVVDGAKNPELIPDNVAYSLLFRFISGKQVTEARERARSYIKQFGAGIQQCIDSDCAKRMSDADVDAIIAAADEFQRRVSILDQKAIEIKKRYWPNLSPDVMAQLKHLQRQKEAVVAEIVASLPGRLSANGLSRVRAHINGRVKVRTKIKPNVPQAQSALPSGLS